ncbi:TetR/AcrR family transcriptional regulator [Aeoliella mucimassa]|uniref:HTH-type transcriptional repressor ComR n=1 Tax=Aeoliella mucimassa TaxID=2527972 RepID=A0A518AGL3_9BACT|nr:TetR/AcrR family transcriptional regulator [Aeoliella mucimassa]QDU53868.1 HTH-type transcriptional repressor ComR [Aeoliella mucimassa]
MPSTTSKTRRGRPKSTAKGEAILDAARDLMLEHGYSATSLEMIAEKAGVGKPTIYSRFGSKEGLFDAVVARRSLIVEQTIGVLEVLSEDPRVDLMEITMRFQKRALAVQQRRWDRLVIAEAARLPQLAQTLYKAGPDKFFRAITRYIRRQSELGRLNVDTPEVAAEHLFGLLVGIELVRGQMASLPKRTAKYHQKRAEALVDMFMAAYGVH